MHNRLKAFFATAHMMLMFVFSTSNIEDKTATGLTGIISLTPSPGLSMRHLQQMLINFELFTLGINRFEPKFLTVAAAESCSFPFFVLRFFLVPSTTGVSSKTKTRSLAGVIVDSLFFSVWCEIRILTSWLRQRAFRLKSVQTLNNI